MIRQTVRSFALLAAGLLLAGGAWGQVVRQTTSDAIDVALEYFGAADGREIQSSSFDSPGDTTDGDFEPVRPYVALDVDGDTITGGNTASITFTLSGATFSQTVGSGNLDRRDGNCDTDTKGSLIVSSPTAGGARGDSSVTFEVTAPDAGLPDTTTMCFWVPNVQAQLAPVDMMTPPTMGVAVTASITQGVTNQNPFPAMINGADVDHDMDPSTPVVPGPITDKVIFEAKPALVTSLGVGQTAEVSLKDRTKIAAMGTRDPSATADPNSAAMGVLVGTLSITVAPGTAATAVGEGIWKLDGGTTVATAAGVLDSTLGGQVMVSVGGPFQSGDKVVFGTGTDARQVQATNDVASTSVTLVANPGMSIVYVPGGVDVLTPSAFVAMANYSFNNLNNNNNLPIMYSGQPMGGLIKYADIEVEGYAYGVVKAGGMESSVVRVTCHASSGMCQVFADCTDQGGTNYFGGPVPIAAGHTGVVDSDAIAAALGGGWDTGRGACDIYSTHNLSVQHMVRSGSGLINNSAVVGRGLDESTDDMLQESLDKICRSVGDDDLSGDSDTTPASEDSTACVPMLAQ